MLAGHGPRSDATVERHAPPASRRSRGCVRGARRGHTPPTRSCRWRTSRPGAHCTGLSVVRGTDDHDLRRRDPRRHRSRTARVGADPHPRLRPGRRCDGHRARLLRLADLLPGRRRRRAQHRRDLRRHRRSTAATVGLATPIQQILAEPIEPPSPASVRTAVVGSRPLDGPLTLSGAEPADRDDVRARGAQGRLPAHHLGRGAARGRLPATAARAGRGGLGRPDVRRHRGRRDRHGRLLRRAERVALRALARRRGPALAVPRRRLHPHGHQQPGRRARPVDVQARLARQRRRHGHERRDQRGRRAPRRAAAELPAAASPRATSTPAALRSVTTLIADEGDVGEPAGPSMLGLVGAASVAEAASSVLGGAPARQSGDMCVTITLRELKKPGTLLPAATRSTARARTRSRARSAPTSSDAAAILDELPSSASCTRRTSSRHARAARPAPGLICWMRPARAMRGAGRRSRCSLKLRRTGTGVRSTRTIHVRIPRGHGARARTRSSSRAPTPTPAATQRRRART